METVLQAIPAGLPYEETVFMVVTTPFDLLTLRLLANTQMDHLPFCFRLDDDKVSEADGGEPRVMSVSETGIGQVRCLRRDRGLAGISLGRPSRGVGGQSVTTTLKTASHKDNKLYPCTPHAQIPPETKDLDDNLIFLKNSSFEPVRL